MFTNECLGAPSTAFALNFTLGKLEIPMKLTPNFSNNPVLQTLIEAIETSIANHGKYATYAQRTAGVRDVDTRSWVAKIEAALSDQEKLEQIRIARREALLPFIAYRAMAHKAFRELVGHRSQICDAIRQGYELLDSKDGNISEELKAAVANNILLAIAEHHRDDAGNAFNWDGYGRTLQDESEAALRGAFQDLLESKPKPRDHYDVHSVYQEPGNHLILPVYPIDPLVIPQEIGETFRRDEMRFVPTVEFEDCVNSKHPALAALVARGADLEEALKELRAAEEYLARNEKGRVNEKLYADRLMAIANGRPDCGYGRGKPLPEQQNDLRRDYESARVSVALATEKVLGARKALAETMAAAIEETKALTGLDGKPVEYAMVIRKEPETIDRKEAAVAAMINCLAMDCLLRRSGRSLLASFRDQKEDLTQGRGKKALMEAVEAQRNRYKRLSV